MSKDYIKLTCGIELTKQEQIDVIESILKTIDDNGDNFNFNSLGRVNIAFTFTEMAYIQTLVERKRGIK